MVFDSEVIQDSRHSRHRPLIGTRFGNSTQLHRVYEPGGRREQITFYEEPSRRPFQFGLRTMLIAVAACGVLFAVMQRVGPLWSVAIGWFLLLAAAHVAANAYATRSRHAPGERSSDSQSSATDADTERPISTATGTQRDFAPATRLRECTRLGALMFALTGVGAIVGCIVGVTLLALVNRGRIGASGIIVGGISCAVLGALLGFLTSTFLGVSLRALREATHEPRRPKGAKLLR